MNKRSLFFATLVFCVVIAGVFLLSKLTQKDQFTLTIKSMGNATSIDLHAPLYENEGVSYDKNKPPLLKISAVGTYSLAKGQYVYAATGIEGYKEEVGEITMTSNQELSVSLEISEQKLAERLPSESPAVEAAIRARYPTQMNVYRLENGKLHNNGEWFSGKLIPTTEQDIRSELRIVLQKNNGQWSIVSEPPDIILSSQKYPQIPKELLIDINNTR